MVVVEMVGDVTVGSAGTEVDVPPRPPSMPLRPAPRVPPRPAPAVAETPRPSLLEPKLALTPRPRSTETDRLATTEACTFRIVLLDTPRPTPAPALTTGPPVTRTHPFRIFPPFEQVVGGTPAVVTPLAPATMEDIPSVLTGTVGLSVGDAVGIETEGPVVGTPTERLGADADPVGIETTFEGEAAGGYVFDGAPGAARPA